MPCMVSGVMARSGCRDGKGDAARGPERERALCGPVRIWSAGSRDPAAISEGTRGQSLSSLRGGPVLPQMVMPGCSGDEERDGNHVGTVRVAGFTRRVEAVFAFRSPAETLQREEVHRAWPGAPSSGGDPRWVAGLPLASHVAIDDAGRRHITSHPICGCPVMGACHDKTSHLPASRHGRCCGGLHRCRSGPQGLWGSRRGRIDAAPDREE